jgi:hypothetical protein
MDIRSNLPCQKNGGLIRTSPGPSTVVYLSICAVGINLGLGALTSVVREVRQDTLLIQGEISLKCCARFGLRWDTLLIQGEISLPSLPTSVFV